MIPFSSDISIMHTLFFISSVAFWGVILFAIISTYNNIRQIKEETIRTNELLENIKQKLPEKTVVDIGKDADETQ